MNLVTDLIPNCGTFVIKNGSDELILSHLEVQVEGGGDLAVRMYRYIVRRQSNRACSLCRKMCVAKRGRRGEKIPIPA